MMKECLTRRPYTSPSAELICLAPLVPVAANWKWGSGPVDWGTNHWGLFSPDILKEQASATGQFSWIDEKELKAE